MHFAVYCRFFNLSSMETFTGCTSSVFQVNQQKWAWQRWGWLQLREPMALEECWGHFLLTLTGRVWSQMFCHACLMYTSVINVKGHGHLGLYWKRVQTCDKSASSFPSCVRIPGQLFRYQNWRKFLINQKIKINIFVKKLSPQLAEKVSAFNY